MNTHIKHSHWLTPLCLAALFAVATPSNAAITRTHLAGNTVTDYPHFEYVKAFNENSSVEIAIDPTRFPAIIGQTCDVYVVNAKKTLVWDVDQTLTDITSGGAQSIAFVGGNIQANTHQITIPFELNANAGMDLGVGYDVVLDCNQDGLLNGDDYIDGRNNEAGFYMVHDTTTPGPQAVTELTYAFPSAVGSTFGIPSTQLNQNLFFPTNVAAADIADQDNDGNPDGLPIIVVSHGNGHQYQWYDHIGNHLASYGYVVISHNNNTAPGPFTASTTTLGHTDAFIDQLAAGAIPGTGALVGHLNTTKIAWIGHSRGGEGVAIAYDRLFDGTYTPVNYDQEDIRLISSMLPTDFTGPNVANPHDANYHLWTASGDADVNGSANCNLCQTYHLHDRATKHRQSTSVQGTGHSWFHDGPEAPSWFTGPCSIGPTNNLTHQILLGHLLPLVKRYVEDNIPSLDFLTRQYESFRPMGVTTTNACVVVSHEYRDGSTGTVAHGGAFVGGVEKTLMIDDYQSQFSQNISSSGTAVSFNVTNLTEGLLNDNNSNFGWTTSDPFNGATQGGPGDTTRGVVFDWNGVDRFYQWGVPVAEQNLVNNLYLSFRGAQGTRHPNTLAILDDLTFDVTLIDSFGITSSINTGAFGGGFEQPYQRSGGWHNEMETIRIRLTDFLNNGSGIDLSNITTIRLDVGPSHGSPEGRIVIDELSLSNDRAVYDGLDNGDPHITTVNGVRYDFQSAGEFTLLADGSDMEIQTRQTPISSANAITNGHTGLKSCVSVNTAVAARVGAHRVSYQPNISGKPDPDGMQLRVDGQLININTLQGLNLGNGGRVSKSPTGNGIEIDFPNGSSLIALPRWWHSQQVWYLNISVFNTPATAGIMGYVPQGDWLPQLPTGTRMGARPAPLSQRYVDLNQTFANAWRVNNTNTLFDYAPGHSTATFTNKAWPVENPKTCAIPNKPMAKPIERKVAQEICRGVLNKHDNADCITDVAVTGEKGFALAFLESQKVEVGATRVDVQVHQKAFPRITFAAIIKHKKTGDVINPEKLKLREPIGYVQFTLNGKKIGEPVKVDGEGRAHWTMPDLHPSQYILAAKFYPATKTSPLLPSTSADRAIVIGKEPRQ